MKKSNLIIFLSILYLSSCYPFCSYEKPEAILHESNEFDYCLNKTSQEQIDVLINFYNSLDGDNWNLNRNWLNFSTSVCNWDGIQCDEECNVNQFYMYSNNLRGFLPDLRNLTHLGSILLRCNFIYGGIEHFGDMVNLNFININSNEIYESMPNLFQLKNLMLLDFSNNHIFGNIDEKLPDSMYLQTLSLRKNNLSGSIPNKIGNYDYLTSLIMDHNNFVGSIPILKNTRLVYISLNNNNLSGIIPEELFDMKFLGHIDLSENNLSGTIPKKWNDLKILREFMLNNNFLEGEFFMKSETLIKTINVSHNNLTGYLNNTKTLAKNLILSNNNFMGEINIENLGTVNFLDIRYNQNMKSNLDHLLLKEIFEPIDVYTIQDNQICNCVKTKYDETFILSDPQYFDYLYCKNIPSFF